MKQSWLWLAVVVLLLAQGGCGQRPGEPDLARSGAMTPVAHPVGPLPGPAETQPVANPLAGDARARLDGRRLFVAFNCSGCHGGYAGGGMGPSLRDDSWLYGGGSGDIYDSIAEGRANGMPAWGTLLPAEHIWQLVSYIETLETPNEADPPT